MITDGAVDINNFRSLWTHILERTNWNRDLFVFANVSQDTLDYTGPSVNKGSKAMLMGLGKEKIRKLPTEFTGTLPGNCSKPVAFLPGTLVVQGCAYNDEPSLARRLAQSQDVSAWPAIILVDDSDEATLSMQEFLWTFFTRFEPAADIYGSAMSVKRFHVGLEPPVVFDCRMKPWYTDVLEVDDQTKACVDEKHERIIPKQWR